MFTPDELASKFNNTRANDRAWQTVCVRFYLSRRHGPESLIEDAVLDRVHDFFHARHRLTCVFGSRQIGNGLPDLTIVSCRPRVRTLPELTNEQILVLGYLRVVNRVSASTLSRKLQIASTRIDHYLEYLVSHGIIESQKRSFRLRESWHDVLDVTTVEAKCTDWRRAISQAIRNTVIADQSYIALPEKQASIAVSDEARQRLGIGIISVDADGVAEIRVEARSRKPLLWKYYFELAAEAAKNLQGTPSAVRNKNRRSAKKISASQVCEGANT